MATRTKPVKNSSYGIIKLVATDDGEYRLEVNIEQSDNANEQVMDRIRATICGLQYLLNKNEEMVHNLGEAFIDGMETGIRASSMGSKKDSPTERSTMGFHASL